MPLRLFAIALLAFAPSWAAVDPPEYTRAAELVHAQRWSEALSRIATLEAQYPNNAKVLNLKGLALAGAGDLNAAMAVLKDALNAHADFTPALKNLAIMEWNAGRKADAALHIRTALAADPRDPVLNAYAALVEMEANNAESAAKRFAAAGRAVAALDARSATSLAVFLGQHGLYNEAARGFEDVIRRGYGNVGVRYDLGLAQFLAGDYADASTTLEQMRGAGMTSDAMNLLAQAYEKQHRTQEAIDTLRTAISRYPRDENNYLDLANLCLDHDSYALGRAVVEIGLKYRPDSARLRLQMGLLYALSGNYTAAQVEFERAAKLEPASDLPGAAMQLATIQQSRLPDAIRNLRADLERKSDSAVLWYLLGAALLRNGAAEGSTEYEEAVTAFRNSIRFDARLPYPYIELGKIDVQRKRFAEAIRVLEKAAQLAPKQRSPYYQLAIAYRHTGKPEAAARMLAKVRALLKEDREAAAHRIPLEKR